MKNEDVCTIDSLISLLEHLRSESPLHGETGIAVCLENSDLGYQPIKRTELDHSEDGAICRIVIDDVPFSPPKDAPASATLIQAARTIINARDVCANSGEHPAGTVGADQVFDDWAADLLETALRQNEFKISAHGKPEDTLPVTVTQNDTGEVFGVEIEIPGYGRPVYLERDPETGHPVLYVSANPDSDDISHKIPLPPFDTAGS